MEARRKVISIVTPCYNEQDNVLPCYEAVKRVFEEQLPEYDCEHVFCDNASTDSTPEVLRDLAVRDPRVKVIFNARNFGPFCSTFNGLLNTTGDAVVVLLAVDLQDPPEVVVEFVKKWEQGYQVVFVKVQTGGTIWVHLRGSETDGRAVCEAVRRNVQVGDDPPGVRVTLATTNAANPGVAFRSRLGSPCEPE